MSAPAVPGAVEWPRLQAIVCTLHPGDVVVVGRGDRMETLLGSCVAIVMTDPRRTVGAMCHIVHCRPPVADGEETGAYAGGALRTMYAALLARGIAPSQCEAWIFGGGNMFPSVFARRHIGEDNANWAIDALARDGVRVIAYDLGGTVYRRLGWTVGSNAPDVVAVPV
jgi:chemotaxis protein CheD